MLEGKPARQPSSPPKWFLKLMLMMLTIVLSLHLSDLYNNFYTRSMGQLLVSGLIIGTFIFFGVKLIKRISSYDQKKEDP
ncbi:MAG: hypothetical protein Q7S32_03445 [bacterium]|nr:hypothetical protein [bacterium]